MKNLLILTIGTLFILFHSCSRPQTELEEFQSSLWKANDELPAALFGYELGGQFTTDTTFVEGRWVNEKRKKNGNSYDKITDISELEIYVADNMIDHISYEITGDPLVVEPLFVKVLQRFNHLYIADADRGVKIYKDRNNEMRIRYGSKTNTVNGSVVKKTGSISLLLRPIDPNNGEYML